MKKPKAKTFFLFIFIMVAISCILIGYFFYQIIQNKSSDTENLASKVSLAEQKDFLNKIAIDKGALYAFELLKSTQLPYGSEVHLLAHIVGDQLYKQQGANGMKYCTDDFRSACAHSIVINLFYNKGKEALSEIQKACNIAPGLGAYDMCYHGLGHGVLAYTSYDLPKAIELCNKTGTTEHKNIESIECVGGAVMEQISGGDHDKKIWKEQRKINLPSGQPFYPCISALITDFNTRNTCLMYLAPHLWELAGQTSAIPSEEVIQRAFLYCENIPISESGSRGACFGGFGKEFVPMAKGKDVRKIDKLTDQEMKKIYRWCLLAPSSGGQRSCILHALGSIYWRGNIDKKVPVRMCQIAPTQKIHDYCFQGLIGIIRENKNDSKYRKEFCQEIPVKFKSECTKSLLSENNTQFL